MLLLAGPGGTEAVQARGQLGLPHAAMVRRAPDRTSTAQQAALPCPMRDAPPRSLPAVCQGRGCGGDHAGRCASSVPSRQARLLQQGLHDAYAAARDLLRSRLDDLKAGARLLLERETITPDDFLPLQRRDRTAIPSKAPSSQRNGTCWEPAADS